MSKAKFIRKINYFYLLLILCFWLWLFFTNKFVFAQNVVESNWEMIIFSGSEKHWIISTWSYISSGATGQIVITGNWSIEWFIWKWNWAVVELELWEELVYHNKFNSKEDIIATWAIVADSYVDFTGSSTSNPRKYHYSPRNYQYYPGGETCSISGSVDCNETWPIGVCLSYRPPEVSQIDCSLTNGIHYKNCIDPSDNTEPGFPNGWDTTTSPCYDGQYFCEKYEITNKKTCTAYPSNNTQFLNFNSNTYSTGNNKISKDKVTKNSQIWALKIERTSRNNDYGYTIKHSDFFTTNINTDKIQFTKTDNSTDEYYRIQIRHKHPQAISIVPWLVWSGLLITEDKWYHITGWIIKNNFTISMRVKFTDSSTQDRNILSLIDKHNYRYFNDIHISQKQKKIHQTNRGYWNIISDDLLTWQRFHLAVVSEAKNIKFYIDWEYKHTVSNYTWDRNLYIWRYANRFWFTWIVDELNIYNIALDDDQIKQLINPKQIGEQRVFYSNQNNLADGKYSYDANWYTWQIIIDTIKPTITPSNQSYTMIPTEKLDFNFAIEDTGTNITNCSYSRIVTGSDSKTYSHQWTWAINDKTCNITWDITWINTEAEWIITVTATDQAGNIATSKSNFKRENTWPNLTSDKTVLFANHDTDDTVEITIDGENNQSMTGIFYIYSGGVRKELDTVTWTNTLEFNYSWADLEENHDPLPLRVIVEWPSWEKSAIALIWKRKPPNLNNQTINLQWKNSISTWLSISWTGFSIKQDWQQWKCDTIRNSNSGRQITYTGNANAIWEDYCVISGDVWLSIVWFININSSSSSFVFTWNKISHQRVLSPLNDLFGVDIISKRIGIKNGDSLKHSLTPQNTITNIHNIDLLAFYDFEKKLITDSKDDFGPIQWYKWWSYFRTTGYEEKIRENLERLQYDADSKQRLIWKPVQEYDWLFVKADTLSPWKNIDNHWGYWDVVLERYSPIHANIEIKIELEDAISYCGDGIKYEVYKRNNLRFTWDLKNNSWSIINKTGIIMTKEPLYFKINSSWNNNCDTTNYRIKIYQLPETNMSDEKWINPESGKYLFSKQKNLAHTLSGIKWWAFEFWQNIGTESGSNSGQYLDIWPIAVNDTMSVAFWINPSNLIGNASDKKYQAILVKPDSYGIAVSTSEESEIHRNIVVTNKTTQQRYNTNVKLDENQRNHIWRSYNWQKMKLYKNWKKEREHITNWSIPNNTWSTLLWRSPWIWQFQWTIDQLFIYSGAQNDELFRTLHQFSLSRETPNKRNLLENKIAFEDGQYDWEYSYTITGWDNSTGTSLLIDFSWPTIQEIHWLTWLESENLIITGRLFDSGTNIDKYNRYYSIWEIWDSFEETITSESDSFDFEIIIPAEDEPITGSLTIVAWDGFWHESQQEFDIERINTGPIIWYNQIPEYTAKTWSNIKFTAMAIDTWSDLIYQRYSWTSCVNILTGETNKTFITGSNNVFTGVFSFMAFDKQWLASDCKNLTGKWESEDSFTELILICEWQENWNDIDCNISDLSWRLNDLRENPSITWKNIALQWQKWSCQFTNNAKTWVTYTRSWIDQGNDSCIIELDNWEHILLAFTNIHTGFLNKRIRPFQTETISDNSPIDALSHIYTTGVDNFQFERLWEIWWNEQNSGYIGLDNNLVRKYSLDRIKITDSTKHFSKFPWEYSWRYFWDNWSTTWKLYFSPKLQSRIINEPLQDYEYINLSKDFVYPGSAKYWKVIYERTSNISGDIEIEVEIENKNPVHCTNTDWIIYAIKKWNEYSISTQIYQKNLIELNDISTVWSKISIWEKLYFIIDSKNDNECDKIWFNAEVYLSPIKDYSNSWVDLQISGVNYNNSHSELWWSYSFSNNQSFLNIWTINKQTWLSFSFWINTNSTNNQSIINKQWSYGLAFKDWKLKVTTDWWRRYETNSKTTESLTNWKRNHLMWTYDWINMYIYINWQLSRSQKIIGYYPSNNNPTYIWRSLNNGQLVWSIDELYVFNKFINSKEAELIYATNIRKIDWEKREFSFKQEKLEDWKYTFTGYINSGSNSLLSGIFTGEVKVDNDPPILEILWSGDNTQDISAEQWKELSIWLSGIDLWSSISWYKYSYKTWNNNFPNLGNTINRTWGNTWNDIITLPAENNPTSWQIQVKIRDDNNNDEIYTANIEWKNIAPIASDLEITWYEWSIITFFASWYDPGGINSYQRYSGEKCLNILTGETNQSFSIWRNEPATETFSYKIWDKQWLSGCATATWIRKNVAPKSSDLYVTSDWNHQITFVVDAYDPGGTTFSGYLFSGNTNCIWNPITWTVTTVGTWAETTTGIEFTVSSELSGTYSYSYQIRDAQWLTWVNKNKSDRECQIATGHWPFINPIAYNFTISDNVGNSLVTWNRLTWSTKPEHRGQLTAEVLSGYKWYCNIVNQRIFFQPEANQTWTGYCEIKITDSNNRSSSVKWFAENIKTTAPETIIEVNNDSFTLTGEDIQYSYYKILTWVRLASSCGSEEYTGYDHSSTGITIDFWSNIYKTVCYYSEDSHWNTENPKSKLFTNTSEETPLIINFNSAEFMKDLFIATITNNKVVSWNIQWLNPSKDLNLNIWTHTITGAFTETNGKKTVRINLLHNNQNFTQDHTFQIDQTAPSRPNIYETSENNLYHIIKRNPSTDNHSGSGIKWYNYEIWNQHVTLYTGFTSANYLNIAKSQYQLNPRIWIKINAEDNVGNISSRSQDKIITIQKESESQTQETIQTPNQFSFNKTTSAKPWNLYTSNEIVIAGLSPNIKIPISLSNGSLFINDVKAENNSSTVKNWDIVYIQLRASENHSDTNIATLFANWVSATYTIVTENKSSSTTSFLEEFRRLLEQLQKTDSKDEDKPVENTEIDSSRRSAPHTAPNGKIYNLYKTIDDRYSSHNFVIKRYFSTLQEMKNHIDKNNPK